jgi:hypothetical protein
MAEHNTSPYRALHSLRRGGLHKALGIKQSDSIPAEKLEVSPSDSDHVKHMKNFAKTMKGFKH